MNPTCENCGSPLPPPRRGNRGRRFCGDPCRKRAARKATQAQPPSTEVLEGPVAASVRTALTQLDLDDLDEARAQMALTLARLVDAGSVPAARELRAVLSDFTADVDAEFRSWVETIKTPTVNHGNA